ncbi:mandelate racemase/muconate lactonizing enzyme family protein [Devosia sp. PTR5]|uniref:Mandelate racemase/muconate lactonizing enzyme family protein n=1 Tax=Devosia oryzisoli TaxID=2774138 RepID=A0A927FXT4_9HYPH|nr:mandelate racemase/muconate lactonizing enzyme family protein [Devosia oryzisoli]MBD8065976.1 mandelate racemase/muconate lactonizing enzyme family protein [Devosia oryzisoli]
MLATIDLYQVPAAVPVRTSFGVMTSRPSLVLRIEDDGVVGFGEVWCNFPAGGAEHRAGLLETVVLPLAAQSGLLDQPAALWTWLTRRLHVLAIQSGEPGPFAQCIAGLECALTDLAARRAGLPLSRFLTDGARDRVAVYASGINPENAPDDAAQALADGYAASKIKIGFDPRRDRENLEAARALVGPEALLMADANQAYDLAGALAVAPVIDAAGLFWFEEPLPHDAADGDWQALKRNLRTPLAAGENFSRTEQFDALPSRRGLHVLQPDLGRWGGVARLLEVAAKAEAEDRLLCPHWLGGGVGLLTSCHVKAASGVASGFVEVDYNDNPLRSEVAADVLGTLDSGQVHLPEKPGIGIDDSAFGGFKSCLVRSREVRL